MAGGPTVVIGFSGTVTIRHVEETAERLRQALASSDRIEVDCSALTEVDFSFIQLIIAAQKSAATAGKTLTMSAPAQGPLLAALTVIGIDDSSRRDFWRIG